MRAKSINTIFSEKKTAKQTKSAFIIWFSPTFLRARGFAFSRGHLWSWSKSHATTASSPTALLLWYFDIWRMKLWILMFWATLIKETCKIAFRENFPASRPQKGNRENNFRRTSGLLDDVVDDDSASSRKWKKKTTIKPSCVATHLERFSVFVINHNAISGANFRTDSAILARESLPLLRLWR